MRLRKTRHPCVICHLHPDRCICEHLPRLDLATRVSLIIHAKELKRTTNSGTLALAALQNSQMFVRGRELETLDLSTALDPAYETLLFYPSKNAIELSAAFAAHLKKPVHLLVPDGNWRQASKVSNRHKELAHLPRVMIKQKNTATLHLRAEHNEFGMSTLEAIARALGFFEGPQVEGQLLQLYQAKLTATCLGRGIDIG